MVLKATMTATDTFEGFEGVRCRVWNGVTESGTKIRMLVPCVMALTTDQPKDLERELSEIKVERHAVYFDHRFIG